MTHRIYKTASVFLMGSAISSLALAGSPAFTPDLLPPVSKAGECYARVAVPAQYSTDSETVRVEDGHTALQVTEPQLRARQEQVMVKEASVHYKVRQPSYKTVTDRVMVRPSYERLSVTRPQFKTITETLQTSKPRLVWKKGNPATLRAQGYVIHSTADAGQGGRGYRSTSEYGRTRADAQLCGQTCEIWCLVEAPGQSVSYNRKVMTSPGDVQRIAVPAKYTNVSRQVVADRGGVEEIAIPPEYRAITVEDVVREASVRKVKVPPKYASVQKRVLTSPERYEWRRVVCLPGTQRAASRPMRSSAQPAYSGARHSGSSYSSTGHSSTSHHSSRTYGQTTSGHHSSQTYGQSRTYSSPSHSTTQTYTPAQTQPSSVKSGPFYYGSDLPAYSEDYTKPDVRRVTRRGTSRYRNR